MKTKKIPDEFLLSGQTTRWHVIHGVPRDPGHCAEKLGVADAWQKKFGHYPKNVLVDKQRIKVKDGNKWYWGPPTEQQVANLTALDDDHRIAVKPHSWKTWMIKISNVVPMTKQVREKLQQYNDSRTPPSERGPVVRRRIDGYTRMVPK